MSSVFIQYQSTIQTGPGYNDINAAYMPSINNSAFPTPRSSNMERIPKEIIVDGSGGWPLFNSIEPVIPSICKITHDFEYWEQRALVKIMRSTSPELPPE